MVKFDRKDYRIMYELELDSRQSYNKIAKKVRLSKDSVIYRVNKLRDAGVIQQFHTIINTTKLGYTVYVVYLKLQGATPEKEKEMIEYLKKKDIVEWVVSIDGEYDLGLTAMVRSSKEMYAFWKEFQSRYVNFISAKIITTQARLVYYPMVFLVGKKKNTKEIIHYADSAVEKIGKVDLKILKLLAPNSRMPVIEIAREVGVTSATVIKKIKEFEKKKVITGYGTLFDYRKLGYQHFKVHIDLHNITRMKEMKFREYVKQNPYINYDIEGLGCEDLEIEILARDLPHFREIMGEMRKEFVDIIQDYSYMLFYKHHKFVFFQ
ncbi:Lrp/AsnC family transcriptional regulator [Nanoarchaeota archaeon]